MRCCNADKFFTAASVIYVILPVIIFFSGWLNYFISVPAVLICVFFAYCAYSELVNDERKLIERSSAKFWLITLAVLCIWVMLSGIGNFSYQNWDFIARNPLYRDLCNYNWPVIYDFSEQTPYVQSIIGNGKAALSYYFSWWLPPAFVCKIFSFGQAGQNICIYTWAVLGVFLTVYGLCRYFRRGLFAVVIIFIFFSGLDVVGYIVKSIIRDNKIFPYVLYGHIEWWSSFQLSSNTTQLFWVFNQSIPAWLIMTLLIQLKSSKNFMALSALIFAYSPWATLGIIPIAIYVLFESKDKFREAFTFQNIAVSILMMIIYGAFYVSGTGTGEGSSHFNITSLKPAINYLFMMCIEVFIFFIIMGKTAAKYRFYYVVIAELLLFPTYTLIQYSSHIRGTIPALFILMVFVMKFLVEENNPSLRIRKICLATVLAVGALTAIGEINRSIAHDILFLIRDKKVATPIVSRFPKLKKTLIYDDVYSIGKMRTDNENEIKIFMKQFFIYRLEDTFFFRYLAKENI